MKIQYWTALIFALCVGSAPAQENCRLKFIASLPLSVHDNVPSIPATIGGKPLPLVLDVGAAVSMLTPSTVAALNLAPKPIEALDLYMYRGEHLTKYVTVRDLRIGELAADRHEFVVMPEQDPGWGGGTIGNDILRAFDDDFDFAGGRFNLVSPEHCPGRVTYWTDSESARIPFRLTDAWNISVTVQLDGKDVDATIDTGSTDSVMSLEWAAKTFAIDAKAPDTNKSGNVDDAMPTVRHSFKSLAFGGIAVSNPRIGLVSFADHANTGRGANFLIGMDILSRLHLYIDFREKAAYVTSADAH